MGDKSLFSRKLCFQHYYQCHPFPPPSLRVLDIFSLKEIIPNLLNEIATTARFRNHLPLKEGTKRQLLLLDMYFKMLKLQSSQKILRSCNPSFWQYLLNSQLWFLEKRYKILPPMFIVDNSHVLLIWRRKHMHVTIGVGLAIERK